MAQRSLSEKYWNLAKKLTKVRESLSTAASGVFMLNLKKAGLFLLGLFMSCLFFKTLSFHNDHAQILRKAFKFVDEGILTHFGNAATGVGYIPGTFQTLISAVPMKIYFSPYSAALVIILFHIASWMLFSNVLKKIFGEIIVLEFLLLYWLSPWRVEQSELYNPGYLFLFSAVHFYTCYYMTKKSFWLCFINVLCIGLCMQVHYSALLLGVLSLILWQTRYVKIHWGGVFAGVAAVFVSLIPYFMALAERTSDVGAISMEGGNSFIAKNLVLVYPVLKGVSYWIRYGAINYGRHIFTEINFLWISTIPLRDFVSAVFHGLKWVFAAVTLILSFRVQFGAGKMIWKENPFRRSIDRTVLEGKTRILYYAFYMFFAMIITVGLSPVELNHWHLILCFPIVTLVMTMAFHKWGKTVAPKYYRAAFVALLLVFTTFNTLGALGSRTHSVFSDFHRDVMNFYNGPYQNQK